jgi:hypothetical protein
MAKPSDVRKVSDSLRPSGWWFDSNVGCAHSSGRSPKENSRLTEGHRPSAHQAAQPQALWTELKRKQLSRRITAFLLLEAFDEMLRAWRREFLGIGVVNGCLQTFAASEHSTNANFATIHFDHAARLFKKRAVPAARLEAIRSHEHATFNYD